VIRFRGRKNERRKEFHLYLAEGDVLLALESLYGTFG
jgi:hypothetical protein